MYVLESREARGISCHNVDRFKILGQVRIIEPHADGLSWSPPSFVKQTLEITYNCGKWIILYPISGCSAQAAHSPGLIMAAHPQNFKLYGVGATKASIGARRVQKL